MIPCHDANNAPCYESTIVSPAFSTGPSVWSESAIASADEEPRMVEILTVLNDVFDSIGVQSESGVYRTPFRD